MTSAVLATIVVLLSHVGAAGIAVFNTLVLMTGIAAAVPYAFSALAQLKWRLTERRAIAPARLVRDVLVAAVSFVVSVLFIVYSRNTEVSGFGSYEPFLYAAGAFLLGVPVYLRNRARMTPPPAAPPAPDAADRTPARA